MRLLTFQLQDLLPRLGTRSGNRVLDVTAAAGMVSAWHDLSAITFLPPFTDADKFLCVGKNYRAHLRPFSP